MNILEVHKLSKHFGGIKAVDTCSFAVAENSITSLIGPNGAGKTTMFNLINGLTYPDSGEIRFKGTAITEIAAHRRARMGMGRTFQTIRLFPQLTALENIMLALPHLQHRFLDCFHPLRDHVRRAKNESREFLALAKLEDKANERAASLSYGQQKLLEIMRTVASGADFFLFDEPAAGVNRTMLNSIIELILKLQKAGKTIMIVEHDMGFVMSISNRVIVMNFGQEIAEGTPDEIQRNPRVLEAYLGVRT